MDKTPELTEEEIKAAYKSLKEKHPGQNVIWDESHRTDPVEHEKWKAMVPAMLNPH
jgi:hypothetical protein